MSRCKACDTILKAGELSRKDSDTDEFIDLCSVCFSVSDRAGHRYAIDAPDFDVVYDDDKEYSPWLQQ